MFERRGLLRKLVVVATLALVAGACNGTDEAAPTPDPDDDGVVVVTAVDYNFVDLPASFEAGTELQLANDSEAEIHELVALRISDDEERPVEDLAQLGPGELMAVAELSFVIVTPPTEEQGMVVEGEGVLASPGRYMFACFIPQGADPDEFMRAAQESEGPPDVEGGPPHIALGMFAEVTVD